MKLKKWSFGTSILLMGLLVGCTISPKDDGGSSFTDSVSVALTARIDSLENELGSVRQRYEGISSQLAALRDSIANAGMANHKHPEPRIGGEAKGDPIRPGDGPRKELK